MDDRGSIPRRGVKGFLLFGTTFRPNLGPSQPPIQLVSASLFPGVNEAGA
jgi:hypothetical protein